MTQTRQAKHTAPAPVVLAAGLGASFGSVLGFTKVTQDLLKKPLHEFDNEVVQATREVENPTPDQAMRTWVPVILLGGLIGYSRVYLGVHHPSDIVVGWIAGSIWLAACMMVIGKR